MSKKQVDNYASPSWAVSRVKRDSGLIEDICQCGVGHPNREWIAKHDCDGKRALGIHGCCGCCSENQQPQLGCTAVVMQEAADEWTAAWRVIVTVLKELGVKEVDNNAKAIIARLAQAGMLVVFVENVKD